MSDKVNNYGNQSVNYESQLASLTSDLQTGKIDADSYLKQLLALEMADLKKNADVESKTRQLESPTDKALGDLKGIGLEALLQFITGENRTAQLKSAESRIDINKQEKEANFQQTMDKINEAIKKAEEEENASWWKKAFGWISTVITAVLSVAAVVVGVITVNPLLITAGVLGCYFAASSVTEQVTGKGLTARFLQDVCKVSEDKAMLAGMIIDCVGSIITGIITGGALAKAAKAADFGVKVALFCARLSYASAIANGATGIGSGVAGGFTAWFKYQGQNMKADEIDLKKALEKLMAEDQENQKTVKAILEFFQHMTDDVNQVIRDKAQTQAAVMSMGGAGAMA